MKTELTLRWIARCLSVALGALVTVFAIGEGPPPLFALSVVALESWLLLLTLAGLVAAWRYELWGAIASFIGIGGFYFTNFLASGFQRFPRGWLFPTIALIPLFFLLAWWYHRKNSTML